MCAYLWFVHNFFLFISFHNNPESSYESYNNYCDIIIGIELIYGPCFRLCGTVKSSREIALAIMGSRVALKTIALFIPLKSVRAAKSNATKANLLHFFVYFCLFLSIRDEKSVRTFCVNNYHSLLSRETKKAYTLSPSFNKQHQLVSDFR